jgi:hypothetical protein
MLHTRRIVAAEKKVVWSAPSIATFRLLHPPALFASTHYGCTETTFSVSESLTIGSIVRAHVTLRAISFVQQLTLGWVSFISSMRTRYVSAAVWPCDRISLTSSLATEKQSSQYTKFRFQSKE